MSPARWFSRLRREPYHLLRHYALEAATLGLLIAALAPRARLTLELHPAHIALPLLAVPLGWWVSAVLHGAAHSSYRWPFLNRVFGELSGAYVGYGFGSFVMIHALHHGHSDGRHDPVSPRGMSFVRYWSGPLRHATRTAVRWLDETHGRARGYRWARLGSGLLFHLNLGLRALAWWLLLGPEAFLLLYLPSIVSNVSILAHINYVCHRDRGDGSVDIVNLDHNLYYRLANCITSGGYYHRAHHLHPGLRDPRRAARAADVTTADATDLTPAGEAPTRSRSTLAAWGSVWKRYLDVHGIWGER